ncbi:MAG: hypothetical protein ACO1PZ_09300 [Gammaproteobacteria bacterium]
MRITRLFFLLFPAPAAAFAADADTYRVDWTIALEAGVDSAHVTMKLEDDAPVTRVSFPYEPDRFSNFKVTSGELEVDDERVRWEPDDEDASLSYDVKITRPRANSNQEESYDALMTDTWALFRGERITPRIRVTTRGKAESKAVMRFDMPDRWNANTAWPLDQSARVGNVYLLDDPERDFDRPRGWFIVGRVSAQRARVGGDTLFSIAAPLNTGVEKMTYLALVSLAWPEIEKAFDVSPAKLLMVTGDDPLWRGGLSGPNSFFFHSSRRAISENGTSPLFHELSHVLTRISGDFNDDWIAEGIAEYYGIELLYRAGAYDDARRADILDDLAEWGSEAKKLRVRNSTGAVTAKSVLVFDALDREVRAATDGDETLDAVTRRLMVKRRVSLDDLREAFEDVAGRESKVLADID